MLICTRRSRPIVDASASSAAAPGRGIGIGGGVELHDVGRCDGADVVPGVDSGGQVELYVSADDGMSESVAIAVDLVLRTSQYTALPYDRKEGKIPEDVGIERGWRRTGPECVRYVLQLLSGYFKILAKEALLTFSTIFSWRWSFFCLCLY